MTSEGLGEVFKGDSADTFAGKFPLVSMGGRANGRACADGERGPPSARAEFYFINCIFLVVLFELLPSRILTPIFILATCSGTDI
jgi:hypothetical protein